MRLCTDWCKDCIYYHGDKEEKCIFTECIKETADEWEGMGRG